MAERMKPASDGELDAQKTRDHVARIESIYDQIASLTGEHMAACKAKRAVIKKVIKEAEQDGIDSGALKAVIKCRELERKAQKQRADLDEKDAFDAIRKAIGDLADTPLGKAAAKSGSVVPLKSEAAVTH